VDIALASTLLYTAALPHSYDVAIAVLGDRDFTPALQDARTLGKRVAIASIKGSCATDFADSADPARVKDFDIIWLDDHLDELELKFEPVRLRCESPRHRGPREAWTTYHPRKGERFYCDECRAGFAREKRAAEEEFVGEGGFEERAEEEKDILLQQSGVIDKKVVDRGFGFIRADDGTRYFFHFTDLENANFEDVREGDEVAFEVKRSPRYDKAGAAQSIRVKVESP
jgi:CspA family cold shock protein